MVRYAEWSAASREERRQTFLVRLPAVALLVVTASFSALLSLVPLASQFRAYAYGGGVLLFFGAATLPSRRIKERRVRRLRDLPSSIDQFAVEISLLRGAYRYGEDTGLATFVDGWLHFEGQRCAFALPPFIPDDFDRTTVRFDGPAGKHRVEFKPLEQGKEFKRSFDDWVRNEVASPADTVLPPVASKDRYDEAVVFNVAWILAALAAAGHYVLATDSHWFASPWALAAAGGLVALSRRIDERRRLRCGLPVLGHRLLRALD